MLVADPTRPIVEGSIGCVTDEELVLLARQGDTDAFDQLVVRHQAAVYRAALAALRNPEDAEEAAQDTFVRAWTNLRRFRGDSSFKTWVLTIAWNRAMSRRRRVTSWWRRASPLEHARGVPDADRADDTLRDNELRRQITWAIDALTPKLRDALLLVQAGEYEYEQIATMLKIPVGTVKWRVSEARRKIKAQLAKFGYVDAR